MADTVHLVTNGVHQFVAATLEAIASGDSANTVSDVTETIKGSIFETREVVLADLGLSKQGSAVSIVARKLVALVDESCEMNDSTIDVAVDLLAEESSSSEAENEAVRLLSARRSDLLAWLLDLNLASRIASGREGVTTEVVQIERWAKELVESLDG